MSKTMMATGNKAGVEAAVLTVSPEARGVLSLDKMMEYIGKTGNNFTVVCGDLHITYKPWGPGEMDNPGCDVDITYCGVNYYDLANAPEHVGEAYSKFLREVCNFF